MNKWNFKIERYNFLLAIVNGNQKTLNMTMCTERVTHHRSYVREVTHGAESIDLKKVAL